MPMLWCAHACGAQVLVEGTYPAVLCNLPRLPDAAFAECMEAARTSSTTLTSSALLHSGLQPPQGPGSGTLRKSISGKSRRAPSVAGVGAGRRTWI